MAANDPPPREPSVPLPPRQSVPARQSLPAHQMVCSTCGTRFLLDETTTPPFCSERCQLVDLGRWLDEENGLPFEGDPGDVPVEHREP